MDKIKVTTAQNIDIEYEQAGLFHRGAAYLIDVGLMAIYGGAVAVILGIAGELVFKISTVLILIYLPIFLYHLIFEIFMQGRSPGKHWMKLHVVRLDGTQPTIGNYVLRWMPRVLETNVFLYGGIALVAMLLNDKGQRLGDMLAGTTVVRQKKKVDLRDTIFRKVENTYQPVFPEVEKLSDKDVGLIKELLDTGNRTGNQKLIYDTAVKVANVMEVRPEGYAAVRFLEAVIKDYNALYGDE